VTFQGEMDVPFIAIDPEMLTTKRFNPSHQNRDMIIANLVRAFSPAAAHYLKFRKLKKMKNSICASIWINCSESNGHG